MKVIGDFRHVPEFTASARTYPVNLRARRCVAVHLCRRPSRGANHLGRRDGPVVSAGVDSIEHGPGLDAATIAEMARRGVAWIPTLCAVVDVSDSPDWTPERRQRAREVPCRLTELLPLAVRLGVPVLAGTDVVAPWHA